MSFQNVLNFEISKPDIMRTLLVFILLCSVHTIVSAQTQPTPTEGKHLIFGVGIYGSGTETGLGFRSGKDTRFAADIRVAKANIFTEPNTGSLINEVSCIYRLAYYERTRFFVGIGARFDWGIGEFQDDRYGVVMPIGVEAYPFPFQNAGLFFEAAPFLTTDAGESYNFGIRTITGFSFYFYSKK